MQELVGSVVNLLDRLDPILGYDVQFACEFYPVDEGMLSVVYDECLGRANVHAQGPLRSAWVNVLDLLSEIQQANSHWSTA